MKDTATCDDGLEDLDGAAVDAAPELHHRQAIVMRDPLSLPLGRLDLADRGELCLIAWPGGLVTRLATPPSTTTAWDGCIK